MPEFVRNRLIQQPKMKQVLLLVCFILTGLVLSGCSQNPSYSSQAQPQAVSGEYQVYLDKKAEREACLEANRKFWKPIMDNFLTQLRQGKVVNSDAGLDFLTKNIKKGEDECYAHYPL